MTTYLIVPTVRDFTVWPEPNQPAYLPCKNKAHDTLPLPSVQMNGATWAVATKDEQKKVRHVRYVTVFTGTCPACGDKYIYSPSAKQSELAIVKNELEHPDPRPDYYFPSQKNAVQQSRGY